MSYLYIFFLYLESETVSWSHVSATGDIPSGTDGHSACIIDNAMYLFGGFVDPVSINSGLFQLSSGSCCVIICVSTFLKDELLTEHVSDKVSDRKSVAVLNIFSYCIAHFDLCWYTLKACRVKNNPSE